MKFNIRHHSIWPGITYRKTKKSGQDTIYGYEYTVIDGKVCFLDNKESVYGHCRNCPKCNKPPIEAETETGNGIDACFGGFIDGVNAACCGHGDDDRAYVMLMRGWRL